MSDLLTWMRQIFQRTDFSVTLHSTSEDAAKDEEQDRRLDVLENRQSNIAQELDTIRQADIVRRLRILEKQADPRGRRDV